MSYPSTAPFLFTFLLAAISPLPAAENEEGPETGHPRPSYAHYSPEQVSELADAVRRIRPSMHRGGWEWDRLLTRYIDSGRRDNNELVILRAYFLSILDRYDEARAKDEPFTIFYNHRSWGSGGRMRIFAELVRQEAITKAAQEKFKTLVTTSLKIDFPDYSQLELGVNNRPYGINGGPAIAVKMFPDHPNAIRHRPWLDALWKELVTYGDTTETNYYPYGPLYLTGLIDMAEGMDKFETEREFLYQHARRYLHYTHGGGVRGNPNSGCPVNTEGRGQLYSDPWNARYYDVEANTLDSALWYRLAQEYKDPEFLWASEQVGLGGRPPAGVEVPAEYLEAYRKRYFWFIERGIKPQVPAGRASISYYSAHKHRAPERLYLCPGRESGMPFASFFIYDRNNNYMHYCDDSDGKLYEYCFDGAKFLHTTGKYTSGRAGVGEAAYDMLTVLPPDMKFPIKEGSGMDSPSGASWKNASMSFKLTMNCRTGPESKNWKFDRKIEKFRRADRPTLGFAYGNMDGYWQLNNDYHLSSVRIGPFGSGTRIQNLRIAGPAGEKILADFQSVPENLKVELVQGTQNVTLKGELRDPVLRIVEGGRRGGKSLQLDVPGEGQVALTLEGLNEKFNGQDQYTRVAYDFLGKDGGGIAPNIHTRPVYFTPMWHRGAILVRDGLKAENRGEDSYGHFTMRNYYGANSRWTRQAILSAEGYLVVRDTYVPCRDVDGYNAAPCWTIKAGENSKSGNNWFDAPAFDHAWWQNRKKRVLLYIHDDQDTEIGQVVHRTSQDIRGDNVRNTFARAKLKAGQPRVWLSVLRPFDEGEDAAGIAASIRTGIDAKGKATVSIGKVKLSITADGQWKVKRLGGN